MLCLQAMKKGQGSVCVLPVDHTGECSADPEWLGPTTRRAGIDLRSLVRIAVMATNANIYVAEHGCDGVHHEAAEHLWSETRALLAWAISSASKLHGKQGRQLMRSIVDTKVQQHELLDLMEQSPVSSELN